MKNAIICLVVVSILGITFKSCAKILWKRPQQNPRPKSELKEEDIIMTNGENEQLTRDLITLSVTEAEQKLQVLGRDSLVVERDGSTIPRIQNFDDKRVLLTVRDGKVIGVDFG